jgi:hypothetical protein
VAHRRQAFVPASRLPELTAALLVPLTFFLECASQFLHAFLRLSTRHLLRGEGLPDLVALALRCRQIRAQTANLMKAPILEVGFAGRRRCLLALSLTTSWWSGIRHGRDLGSAALLGVRGGVAVFFAAVLRIRRNRRSAAAYSSGVVLGRTIPGARRANPRRSPQGLFAAQPRPWRGGGPAYPTRTREVFDLLTSGLAYPLVSCGFRSKPPVLPWLRRLAEHLTE